MKICVFLHESWANDVINHEALHTHFLPFLSEEPFQDRSLTFNVELFLM